MDETHSVNSQSPYAASKASADHIVRAWFKTYDFPVITTHCSNNYGPNQNYEKFDIAFNPRYLLEGLKVIASKNVILKCNLSTNPAVLVPEDKLNFFTYLIMPVQVRS